jgi:DNA repair exonuclease SbcCD ATPase subunit
VLEIISLDIHNFLSIRDAHIDVSPGLHFIEGNNCDMGVDRKESNGSGKSALVRDSITWAVWGIVYRKDFKADKVVNIVAGCDCYVMLRFKSKGNTYDIKRYRKHSEFGNDVDIIENGVSLTQHRNIDTQKIIDQVFPISQDVWRYGIQVGQGMPDKFLDLPESAKQELLFSIVDISIYDKALEIAKEEEKQAIAKNIELSTAYRFRSNQITEMDAEVNKNETALKDFDVREKSNAESMRLSIKNIEDLINKRSNRNIELNRLLDDDKAKKKDLSKSLIDLQKSLNKITVDLVSNKTLLSTYEKDKEGMSSIESECPLCKQQVNKEVLEKHLCDVDLEIRTLKCNDSDLSSSVKYFNDGIDDIKKELFDIEQQCDRHEKELRQGVLSNDIAKKQKEGLVSQLSQFENQRSILEERVNQTKKVLSTLSIGFSSMKSALYEAEKNKSHWEYWKKTIPNLRSSATSGILSFLNSRLIEYSNLLSSGTLRVSLYQEGYGSGSKIKAEVFSASGTYGMSSGGECKRLDLSIYLALSDLIRCTAGVSCNLLVLDEITDSLSIPGVEDLLNTVRVKAGIDTCVMVISHNPAVRQAAQFDSAYIVTKKGDLATVEHQIF